MKRRGRKANKIVRDREKARLAHLLLLSFPTSYSLSSSPHNLRLSKRHHAYFVDLFVRKSNDVAVQLYTSLGYVIYRTVLEYYSGDNPEDAYGTVWWRRHIKKTKKQESQWREESCEKKARGQD